MTAAEHTARRLWADEVLELADHPETPEELREALHERLVALALEQPEVVVLPAR